ncbi:YciI family protein [Schauerella aestuarii]|jgi:uncharacterized protein YciI|uniref:YciI family protein n=1 Tax=Schauerella aestuarii TaxID=2511204 RepID=UPI001367EA95|nr:YciI family protein [Achromobacter aestuarii]MYZ43891.1 YciI family protein [Achromobacter aestuarii]
MPYLIETFDKPGHQDVRKGARAAHLEFLERNKAKLLACGAKLADDGTDLGGGIYIVDVDSRAEAEALIAEDPFTAVDLFERVNITRWRKAYLDGKNFL